MERNVTCRVKQLTRSKSDPVHPVVVKQCQKFRLDLNGKERGDQ